MSIIANSSVDKVKFDSTIECTIVDATDKLIGKYKVKNESYAEFYAYSQITTYNKDDKVYVQIPKGDYNSTKFIVGKKTDKNEDKPYNFVNPFNTFIDLTGNFFIAKDNNKEVWSILANGNEEEIEITPNGGITFTDEQQGFTRLGLRADFRAWLETLGVVSGNYGLKLNIYGIKDDTADNIKKIENSIKNNGEIPLIASIDLDTNDMYGNPYNFEGYYSQEIVIDTSAVAKIYNIKIFLYQKDNFKDSNNNLISYANDFNMSVPPNNIFVKDIYMGLGISADEIENEYVRLYSLDGSTYVIDDKGQIDSKTIRLKWVHFDEDGNRIQITEHKKDDTFEVRWYMYEFGAPSADEYSGVYWIAIEDNKNNFYYQLKPRSNKNQEQVKVIILYNGKVYRSNIITFNNEKQVPNDATIDSLNALSIHCEDQTNGNYLIYNQANYLMNRSDGKISRKLTLHFDSKTYAISNGIIGKNQDGESKLVEAQRVIWQIPIKNTMLNFGIKDDGTDDTYKEIVIDLTNENVNVSPGEFSLNYTINTFYSSNKSNNTVIAKVEKDGIVYTAIKDFTFGQAGTNGTDCTLVIDMIAHENLNNKVFTAIRSGVRDNYTFRAQLYDNEGKEITDFKNCSWTWSFMSGSTVNNVDLQNTNNQNCVLRVNTTNSIMSNLIILQVKLSGWGDYDLTAYYPVPITTLDNIYINGPIEVIYLSNGEPTFSKEPYKLFIDGEVDDTVTWSIYPTGSTDKFIGQIKYNDKKKEYRLSPMNFYVDGVSAYGVQGKQESKIVWSQPILVIQNKYPSAMVNKWDGQLNIDSDNNFIGVAQIAAGKKENNNTFTGVLMGSFGDGKADSSLSKNTGIYGYYQGKQVYALKDDGTATFGKSGNGQIEIKGDSGKIKSAGYDSGNGLLIDLKESKIDGKSNSYSAFLLNKSSPYLTIKDPVSNTTLMNVGDNSYYLKSKNYTTDGTAGMHINLNDGSIIANTGTFKDAIYINYAGSTGTKYWKAGTYTLNYILNEIATAAYDANYAVGQLEDLVGTLNRQIERIDTNQTNLGYVEDVLSIGTFNYNPYLHAYGRSYPRVYVTTTDAALQYNSNTYVQCDSDGGHVFGGLRVDGEKITSDRHFKQNIDYQLVKYKDLFFNLKPASFEMKSSPEKTKLGFIAQDVQEALEANNYNLTLTEYDKIFDGLCLDYNSLFVLNTYMLQEAYKEILLLKSQIKDLKEKKENE